MITLFNVTFLVKKKHHLEHSTIFWGKYIINSINIPDNVYNDHCNRFSDLNYRSELLTAYLLGWFYKYNEDVIHEDNIDTVLLHNYELCTGL